ncbi:MAG: FprA family A-type flavoprotein [Chloroflexi bacterium]|jgi:flavorubredoxin|nr:FprA family A-type flavoprotein [Chloroflexota bacterium]MBT7081234.1 FprA family A-type flavoprotein [Chloroflexota bacterium]MBT7289947.1 FprA family A-type flavoprotein [Chloroflexota bacterium]
MRPREIVPGIYEVGAVDWDRRLFDSLIPLPDGTSYNSYLIKGSEKTVLVDSVDPTMESILLNNLSQLELASIDYVICHHAEQDHAGTIPKILEMYPEAKVITSPKCKGMLEDLLNIEPERFITVADKETISLGDRTLEFIHTPWVHWPETMVTYLKEDNILFSCDFFGSHLATTDQYWHDAEHVFEGAKRYFAEIMMPFRNIIAKNLTKLKDYQIDYIAPSHGPLYDCPGCILEAYDRWVLDEPKNIVVLPYVSMHGSTRIMVEHLVIALSQRGVTVKQFDLTVTDIGKLAEALVDAATIVIGTPTILAGPHPAVAYAAILANALRPTTKFASIIGSYGWGGKTVETIAAAIPNLKVEILDPVLCKGLPKQADLEALDALANAIAQKHKEAGFK